MPGEEVDALRPAGDVEVGVEDVIAGDLDRQEGQGGAEGEDDKLDDARRWSGPGEVGNRRKRVVRHGPPLRTSRRSLDLQVIKWRWAHRYSAHADFAA